MGTTITGNVNNSNAVLISRQQVLNPSGWSSNKLTSFDPTKATQQDYKNAAAAWNDRFNALLNKFSKTDTGDGSDGLATISQSEANILADVAAKAAAAGCFADSKFSSNVGQVGVTGTVKFTDRGAKMSQGVEYGFQTTSGLPNSGPGGTISPNFSSSDIGKGEAAGSSIWVVSKDVGGPITSVREMARSAAVALAADTGTWKSMSDLPQGLQSYIKNTMHLLPGDPKKPAPGTQAMLFADTNRTSLKDIASAWMMSIVGQAKDQKNANVDTLLSKMFQGTESENPSFLQGPGGTVSDFLKEGDNVAVPKDPKVIMSWLGL
jgi:hypothetical protein